ncbi:acyl transferase [Cruoricaptor ignavus]|uniref:LuxE/PaaK family acyltransferase n=1 Tax=Cruoricaptor ignavus TaxID=1118202 RepID=UPI00370D193D
MKNIFSIKNQSGFLEACLETFRFQYENVPVYRRFVELLNINPTEVRSLEQIPFLPIEAFKKHQIIDENFPPKHYFQSSGTTNIQTKSRHFVADFQLYEESIERSFRQFIGNPEDFIFVGLLPNYSENPHSSLIYMVDFLMKKSGRKENGYFLYNHQELFNLLQSIDNQKVILFGVSFALLDFLGFLNLSQKKINFSENLTVIETGGMKGRKEEMTKDELLDSLKSGFQTERIFSEYSMTELLSQAYSLGGNIYESPNWMRILVRSLEDPMAYMPPGKNGAISIIDLANRHSCSFIATQDLGILHENSAGLHPKFSVTGRVDHSDIRGCSLLVS